MRWLRMLLVLTLSAGGLAFAGPASAMSESIPGDFMLEFNAGQLDPGDVTSVFSDVRNFSFELDLAGPLSPGEYYDNASLMEARYLVRGRLSTNPPTPSGFPAFLLNRFPSGEGPISPADWDMQASYFAFQIARDVDLIDGVQLSELMALRDNGLILKINAREDSRLDRARYHPPLLMLYADGTGLLMNSNNSSGKTGTVNPGTGLEVDVDFGDEYVTRFAFDPAAITVISASDTLPVPEPGTALLLGLGLLGLSARRRGRARQSR